MSGPDIALVLGGVAGVLGGIAAIITAWRTSRKVDRVQEQVGNGGASVTELLLTNVNVIENMHRILERIDRTLESIQHLDEYQHTRNHDILNALTPIGPLVQLLGPLSESVRDLHKVAKKLAEDE